METKRFYRVDADTGEVDDGFCAVVFKRARNGFGDKWCAMGQEAAELLALNGRALGMDGLRLLWWMISRMSFENHILVSQSEVARRMGMKQPAVSRSMRRLVDLGVLEQGPKVGSLRSYRLNPSFGWRGSGKTHQKALTVRMKAAGITGVV